MTTKPTTHEKALRINVDAAKYGTFAEIGAGQEVARWFFRVGGAAGTVAKAISAYDTAVSDALYGPSDRYVSRQRRVAILAGSRLCRGGWRPSSRTGAFSGIAPRDGARIEKPTR